MALRSIDAYLARIAAGYSREVTMYSETLATTGVFGTGLLGYAANATEFTVPTMPSGVTAYRLVSATFFTAVTQTPVIIAKKIVFGSLNIGTNAWTAGSGMPTVTEGGVSRQKWSPIFIEVTTALNSAPGSLSVTYVDQDGNTAEASPATALTASAAVNSAAVVYTLNSTDVGARDVTGATQSGGTSPSGVVQLFGLVPMAVAMNGAGANLPYHVNFLTHCFPPPKFLAGEKIVLMPAGGATHSTKAAIGQFIFVGED